MRLKELAKRIAGAIKTTELRKGSASPRLDEAEFKRRFRSQFQDDALQPLDAELSRIAEAA